jgi:FdhD protein
VEVTVVERNKEAFDETGGLHAAALFSANGTLLFVREDVGRTTLSTR